MADPEDPNNIVLDVETVPRMTPEMRKLAGRMFGSGVSPEAICDRLRVSSHQLTYAKGKEDFQEAADEATKALQHTITNHGLRMAEILEDVGYTALREILKDPNPQTAGAKMKALEMLTEHTKAHVPARTGPEAPGVQVNIQQNAVQDEAAKAIKGIAEEMPGLLKTLAEMDPDKHVHTGEDALPQNLLDKLGEAQKRHQDAEEAGAVDVDFTTEDDSADL